MPDILLLGAVGGSAVSVLLMLLLLLRSGGSADAQRVAADLRSLNAGQDRALRALFEELRSGRRESAEQLQGQRAELSRSMKDLGDSMLRTLENITSLQNEQLSAFAASLAELTRTSEGKLEHLRETVDVGMKQFRDDSLRGIDQFQTAMGGAAKQVREELTGSLRSLNESTLQTQHALGDLQKVQLESFGQQIGTLATSSEKKSEELRSAVELKLAALQEESRKRLDEIRQSVDETLQGTLERRLGESFRRVSERLEQVQQGLGEMQVLAGDVGDLKKLIHHVRARGVWGEVQLARLLADVLTPEQYAQNVQTRPGSEERVAFAIQLPGRAAQGVWLPIDAHFQPEDCDAIARASEQGDAEAETAAGLEFEQRLRARAAAIAGSFVCPPHTTEFAILFLPTEGLYAEVIRRPGLVESLQREHRVVVSGPTTFAALLNSLHMGFHTLALQRRSAEVWEVLGAVKTEFEKFGSVMQKIHRKLQEASLVVEQAQHRTLAMERTLRDVEPLPEPETQRLLGARPDAESEPPA